MKKFGVIFTLTVALLLMFSVATLADEHDIDTGDADDVKVSNGKKVSFWAKFKGVFKQSDDEKANGCLNYLAEYYDVEEDAQGLQAAPGIDSTKKVKKGVLNSRGSSFKQSLLKGGLINSSEYDYEKYQEDSEESGGIMDTAKNTGVSSGGLDKDKVGSAEKKDSGVGTGATKKEESDEDNSFSFEKSNKRSYSLFELRFAEGDFVENTLGTEFTEVSANTFTDSPVDEHTTKQVSDAKVRTAANSGARKIEDLSRSIVTPWVKFSANDDAYILFSQKDDYEPSNWIKVQADVYFEDKLGKDIIQSGVIVQKSTEECGYPLYSLEVDWDKYIFSVNIRDNIYTVETDSGDFERETWQRVAGVYTGEELNIYVDDLLVDSVEVSGQMASSYDDKYLIIGYDKICDGGQLNDVSIDNVIIRGQ